jgi:hypothetical protein
MGILLFVLGCVLFCLSVVWSEYRKDKAQRREGVRAHSDELSAAMRERERGVE